MLNINTLYNGSCFELLKEIPDNYINLIITDPPYLHEKGGGKNHGTEGKSKIANSDMFNFNSPMMKNMSSFGENEIYSLLDEFKRIMKKMNCYIFCNDSQLLYYLLWAKQNKKKTTVLIWEKPLSILNRNRFSQNVEYIVRIYDNGTSLNKLDITNEPHKKDYYSKVRKFNQYKGKDKLHPLQKPYDYIAGLIELNSNEGDIILDCFSGSGQTLRVAKDYNRNFIGIEINKEYYDISVKYVYGE